MAAVAEQVVVAARVYAGSEGLEVRPMNSAMVKMELTFTMPSKAIMWMTVVLVCDILMMERALKKTTAKTLGGINFNATSLLLCLLWGRSGV